MILTGSDFIFRGIILLGIAISIFTNLKRVIASRRINEQHETIKYDKTWLQHIPIWASFVTSLLIGLGLWRFGSLLLIQSSGENKLILLNLVLLDTKELEANQYFIFAISAIGALGFIVFSIMQALAYQRLDINFSSFIDVKKGNYLVTEGIYGIIRHPLYLCEIMLPLAASLTLLLWPLFLWTMIVQLPLYIMRTNREEDLLEHYYEKDFLVYRQYTGKFFPTRFK